MDRRPRGKGIAPDSTSLTSLYGDAHFGATPEGRQPLEQAITL